ALHDAHWMMALVNHLWQSTVFLLGIWLLTILLRHNHARTRYLLWMRASVKFLVPLSILISAGAWLHSRAFVGNMQPSFSTVIINLAQPFSAISASGQMVVAVPQTATSLVNHVAVTSNRWDYLPIVLMAIWICGFFFVF